MSTVANGSEEARQSPNDILEDTSPQEDDSHPCRYNMRKTQHDS